MINYKNRHPWMTANLRSLIIEKNRLRLQSHKNPGHLVLTAELKQKCNQLTSDLRNAEIRYYSKQLELNKRDLTQSWKILKTIIGKGINKTARKSASASMAILSLKVNRLQMRPMSISLRLVQTYPVQYHVLLVQCHI